MVFLKIDGEIQMNVKLPEIKENDLVLLQTAYTVCLFYSDGKIAQTDFDSHNLESELAKIEEPEGSREQLRKQIADEHVKYCVSYGEDQDRKYVVNRVDDIIKSRKREQLIEKLISEGYLKEYVSVFGRDNEIVKQRDWFYAPLESTILDHGPVVIFGCQKSKSNFTEENVLDLGLLRYRFNFGGKVHEMVLPKPTVRGHKYITVPKEDFVVALVDKEAIRDTFKIFKLEAFLDSGIFG